MIMNLGPLGRSKAKMPPLFTLTVGGNTYRREDFLADSDNYISGVGAYKEKEVSGGIINWELAVCGSGTLKFQRVVPKVDVFMIGGGANGEPGSNDGVRSYGGDGGKGGTRRNLTGSSAVSVEENTGYQLEIGSANSATKGFGYTAAGGNGRSGGTGANVVDNSYAGDNATAGKDGEEAFGSNTETLLWNGYLYGAGGGAGGAKSAVNYYAKSPSLGGKRGAGDGGAENANGGRGTNNSGSGGGGGGFYGWAGSGGAGGSGIIIIRNAR